MKRQFTYLFAMAILYIGCAQPSTTKESNPTAEVAEKAESTAYDEALAKELGADDYGMKSYVMAFLKKGPNRPTEKEAADKLQAAHMANIKRLGEEGKLVMAGPFLDDGELRGIYVFNVATIEEAKALTETDPAIKAGSLVMELHPWYGSAGLLKVKELHGRLQKNSF